ncbi:MAG: glucose-1-phosphate adenylyltransferase [bacterium]|nr:glucose-1-phosphate adenylyltransferase [bacterium]
MRDALVFILAGGKGERLQPLTLERAKPSVPFGGKFRIIDFVINNMINSGFYKLKVLTQFKSDSLIRHLSKLNLLNPDIGQFLDIVPAQMRRGEVWYRGTADAIYQNINLIIDEDPDYVMVFGGDHIYKMDVFHFYTAHRKIKADMTISAIPVPKAEAHKFGILQIDPHWRVTGFVEKPKKDPPVIPGHPDLCLSSMGNYIFNREFLTRLVTEEVTRPDTTYDFGKDIIPRIYLDCKVYAYDFSQNRVPGSTDREKGYWRDVGDTDAYYDTNMDLCSVHPVFNMYNDKWPIRTVRSHYPAAKFVFEEYGGRMGVSYNSLVGEGSIVSGAFVRHSVIFQNVFLHSFSFAEDCIIFDNVDVGRYAKLKRVIVDKNVRIPQHEEIGFNYEKDKARFHITPNGVIVIPKGYKF